MSMMLLFVNSLVFCAVETQVEDSIANEQSYVEMPQFHGKVSIDEEEEIKQVTEKEIEQVAEKEDEKAEEVSVEPTVEQIPKNIIEDSIDSDIMDDIEKSKDIGNKASNNPFEAMLEKIERQAAELKNNTGGFKLPFLDSLGGDCESKDCGHSHEKTPTKEESALDRLKKKINKKKAKKDKPDFAKLNFDELLKSLFGDFNGLQSSIVEEDAARGEL